MKSAAVAVVSLIFSVACSGEAASGRSVVYVVDASGSVTTEARTAAVVSVGQALQTLDRGDRGTVIPITGDVHAETLGHALRFELSTRRQPYDADRRRLVREIHEQLSAFIGSATASASANTDLLGTFSLAAEELGPAPVRVLVCLSDFIQDDAQFNFNTERRLANDESSRQLAQQLAGSKTRFDGVHVYLGSTQSSDLARLSKIRRTAIQVFWTEFFAAQGATVQWATDGPAHVSEFIRVSSEPANDQGPKE